MEWLLAKDKTRKQDCIMVEFKVAMMSTCIIPLHGLDRRVLTAAVGVISGPRATAKIEPSIGAISPVEDLHGRKKHSEKADQSTLANRGSKHA